MDESYEDQIERLDQFQDSLNNLWRSAQRLLALPLSGLAALFSLITGDQTERDRAALAIRNLGLATEAAAASLGKSIGEVEGADVSKFTEWAEKAPPAAKAALTALAAARKEFDKFSPLLSGKGGGSSLPDLPNTKVESAQKRAADAASSFTQSLQKQIAAAEGQAIALTEGEDAAQRFALRTEFATMRTELLRKLLAEGVPDAAHLVDRAFGSINVDDLSDRLIGAKRAVESLKARNEDLAKSFLQIDQNQEKAIAAGQDLLGIIRALDSEGFSPLEKAIAEINSRFDEMKVAAIGAGEATGQDVDALLKRIEFFRRQQTLLAQQPTTALDAIDTEEGQRMEEQRQRMLDLGKSLGALTARKVDIEALNQALGGGIDVTSEKIGIQRERVAALVKEYGSLSPAVRQAVEELRSLEAAKSLETSFQNVFASIAKGLDQTLQGILQGTQSFGEAMKNLARNILLSISNELNKQFILNPLKEALQGFLPKAPSFTGAPIPAAAPNIQNFPNVAAPAAGAIPDLSRSTFEFAGTSLTGSATALDAAAVALQGAAAALSGGALGAATPLASNIDQFSNVRAPAQLEIPDISEWTIELTDHTGELFDSVGQTISSGLESLTQQSSTGFGGFFSQLGSLIADGLSALTNSGGGEGGGWADMASSAVSAIGSLFSFLEKGGPVKAVPHFASGGPVSAMHEIPLPAYRAGALPHFASGGEVPAILHNGEFVVRASEVAKPGALPFLEKFNAGEINIPKAHFATGGRVGSLAVNWRGYDTGGAVGPSAMQPLQSNAMATGHGAAPKVNIEVNGDVIPKNPNATHDEIFKVTMEDFAHDGPLAQTLRSRMRPS